MKRRHLLQAGAALPLAGWTSGWAQSPDRNLVATERKAAPGVADAASLLIAPRRALVIGNSRYRFGALKNPANDARAIGEELKRTGFEVVTGLDLPRREMLEAIHAYATTLTRDRAVGVFYFAGHGVQLAWRNYLLPSDAEVAKIEDIQAKCVDVNAVIEGIGKAANPMNVIILDACRENPFGGEVKLEQKGLSQLDAPPGTFIAYATAPGNLASDGDGANGLYTEQLLREMRVPETKIEDVFKRVRLTVRRRSNGQQIPWESTSLEEDFWFIPPAELRKLAQEQAGRLREELERRRALEESERAYEAELKLWEIAAAASEPFPLEEYLRRYPSGRFSEIAQAQLDAILARQGEQRIQIVQQAQNPYSAGSAHADTGYKVGDRYRFQVMDLYSRVVSRELNQQVSELTASEVIYNAGGFVTDLLGNVKRQRDGAGVTSNQQFPAEFHIGKRWRTSFTQEGARGEGRSDLTFRITGKERVSVPAGTFDTFRIEGTGTHTRGTRLMRVVSRAWFAPQQVRRPVAREEIRTVGRGRESRAERIELVSFSQK